MKILAISNFFPPYHAGGYGLLCYRLVSGLQQRGHEVTVLTTDPRDFAQTDAGAQHSNAFTGDVVRRLRLIPGTAPAEIVRRTLHNHRVVRQVLRSRFDLVYGFSMDEIGFDVYQTALTRGIPGITVVGDTWLAQAWRNLPVYDPWTGLLHPRKHGIARASAAATLRAVGSAAGAFTASQPATYCTSQSISRFLHDDLVDSGAPVSDRCTVVPIPLPEEYFDVTGRPVGHSGVRAKELRALFVGRMELLKGPDTAIQALAEAVRGGANVTLTLTGLRARAGEVGQQLEALVRELGVACRIRWEEAPDTASLIRVYQNHDVFLFPSRIIEGFGMVNAEAMACGLPVLGTAIGGSAELMLDGETGFRYAPGDHLELGRRLVQLAGDRALLERLSSGALQAVQRFEYGTVLNQVEELIEVVTKRQVVSGSDHVTGEPAVPQLVPR